MAWFTKQSSPLYSSIVALKIYRSAFINSSTSSKHSNTWHRRAGLRLHSDGFHLSPFWVLRQNWNRTVSSQIVRRSAAAWLGRSCITGPIMNTNKLSILDKSSCRVRSYVTGEQLNLTCVYDVLRATKTRTKVIKFNFLHGIFQKTSNTIYMGWFDLHWNS